MDIGGGRAVGRQSPLLDIGNDCAVALHGTGAAAGRQFLEGLLRRAGPELGLGIIERNRAGGPRRRIEISHIDTARTSHIEGRIGYHRVLRGTARLDTLGPGKVHLFLVDTLEAVDVKRCAALLVRSRKGEGNILGADTLRAGDVGGHAAADAGPALASIDPQQRLIEVPPELASRGLLRRLQRVVDSQVDGLEAGEIQVSLEGHRAVGQEHRPQVHQQLANLLPRDEATEIGGRDEIIVEPREMRAGLKTGRGQIVSHVLVGVAGAGVVAIDQQPGRQSRLVQTAANNAQFSQHVGQRLGSNAEVRQLLEQHEGRRLDTTELRSILRVESVGIRNHLLPGRQRHRAIISLHCQRQEELPGLERGHRQRIVRRSQVDTEEPLVRGNIQGFLKERLATTGSRVEPEGHRPRPRHRVTHRIGQKTLVGEGSWRSSLR